MFFPAKFNRSINDFQTISQSSRKHERKEKEEEEENTG